MKPILLIAGYDKAPHSIAIAERLRRLGTPPDLVLIAYPLSLTRIRTIVRTRGLPAIAAYVRGKKGADEQGPSPLSEYLTASGLTGEPSLTAWAKRWNVRCAKVSNINSPAAARIVSQLAPAVTAYTGGGILKSTLLDAAGRHVLNAHSGPLPAIRGMNACEWSLLLEQPLSVTLHLIDEGVDTGPELERIAVRAQTGDTIASLRQRCIVAGIEGLVRLVHAAACGKSTEPFSRPGPPGRQCFVLAPALREVLSLRLPELISKQQELAQQG